MASQHQAHRRLALICHRSQHLHLLLVCALVLLSTLFPSSTFVSASAVCTCLDIWCQDTQTYVVRNGVVETAWAAPYVCPPVEFPSYQGVLNGASNDCALSQPTFTMTLTYSSSNAAVVMSKLSESFTVAWQAGLPQQVFTGTALTQCMDVGSATISTNAVFTGTNPPSPLQWSYTKTCTKPRINIGTSVWGNDAVKETVPQPTFSSYQAPNTGSIDFYISIADLDSPQPFSVTSVTSSSPHVTITPNAWTYTNTIGNNGQYVAYDHTGALGKLNIPITCKANAPASANEVTVSIYYTWPNTPLIFSFLQICGTFTSVTGLTVGTTPGGSDIAVNGVVTDAWNPLTGYPLSPNALAPVWNLCYQCGNEKKDDEAQQKEVDAPGSSITYDLSFNTTSTIYNYLSSGPLIGTLKVGHNIPILNQIVCSTPGTATTTMTLQAAWNVFGQPSTPFTPLQFAFKYECIQPSIDMAWSQNDLVEKNTVVPHTPLLIFPDSQPVSLVHVWLDNVTSTNLVAQPYVFTVKADPDQLGVSVYDRQGEIAFPTSNPNFTIPVQLTWHCRQLVNASIELHVNYGWGPEIIVPMIKNCVTITPRSPHLILETQDGSQQVIESGEVNPLWSTDPTGFGPWHASKAEYPTFRIRLQGAVPPDTQSFNIKWTSSDETIMKMNGTGVDGDSGTLQAPNLLINLPGAILCLRDGDATLTGTLTLSDPPLPTLTFAFTKTCIRPLIQIGTQPWQSDVVNNGVVVTPSVHIPYQSSNTTVLYLFETSQAEQPFTLSFVNHDPATITIDTQNIDYSNIYQLETWILIGPKPNPIGTLTIPITCLPAVNSAPTLTQVEITMRFNWDQPIVFSFLQQCGQDSFLDKLDIGTGRKFSDIALNGVVSTTWQPKHYAPNALALGGFEFDICYQCVPDDEDATAATTSTSSSITIPQLFYDLPKVSYTFSYKQNIGACYNFNFDPVTSAPMQGELLPGKDLSFPFRLVCDRPGIDVTTFELDLVSMLPSGNLSYPPLQYGFEYVCINPLIDMNYMSATSNPMLIKSQPVGTQSQPLYNITADQNITQIWLYLDDSSSADLTQQPYKLLVFRNPQYLDLPIIVDPQNGLAKKKSTDTQPINITLNCKSGGKSGQSNVIFLLSYGFNQADTIITLSKDCQHQYPNVNPYPLTIVTQDIGTVVVTQGVVASGWTEGHPGDTGPYVCSPSEYPSYALTLNNGPPANFTQAYEFMYESSDPTIVHTTKDSETGVIHGSATTPLFTMASTQCLKTGTALITVTLLLTQPAQAPLVWIYQKTCRTPLIQVGLSPYGNNVVHDTVYQPSFSSYRAPNTGSIQFFMYETSGLSQAFLIADVFSESANILINLNEMNYTQNFGASYILSGRNDPIGVLTIPVACVATVPPSLSRVTVLMQYFYPQLLTFSFIQQCGQFDTLPGLSIGTSDQSAGGVAPTNIAINGQVSSNWWPTGYVYAPNSISSDTIEFDLCYGCVYAAGGDSPSSSIVRSADNNPSKLTYTLTYLISDSNAFIFSFINSPTHSVSGPMIQTQAIHIPTTVVCNSGSGAANVTFQLDMEYENPVGLNMTLQSLFFQFQYSCILPYFDVIWQAQSGQLNPLITLNAPVQPLQPFIIPTNEASSIFYVYLDAYTSSLLKSQAYSFTLSGISYSMNDTQNGTAVYQNGRKPIIITWNECLKSGLSGNYQIALSLSFGWQSPAWLQQQFVKQCPVLPPAPTPTPADDGGHGGGMSTVGAVFLSLFLISIFLYCVGCAWNYFRSRKRGWYILPGYASATRYLYRRQTGGRRMINHGDENFVTYGSQFHDSTEYGHL